MDIRPARESDALGVARVHVHTWQAAYRANPELWVADTGSEIIGWAAFGPTRGPDAMGDSLCDITQLISEIADVT
jgi:hypothetical protein